MYDENICAFPHTLGSPFSYMTFHLIPSEFFFFFIGVNSNEFEHFLNCTIYKKLEHDPGRSSDRIRSSESTKGSRSGSKGSMISINNKHVIELNPYT